MERVQHSELHLAIAVPHNEIARREGGFVAALADHLPAAQFEQDAEVAAITATDLRPSAPPGARVAGASSEFGRAIAVAFAAQGAKIVVGDLQPEPSKGGFETAPDSTTVEEIEGAAGTATFVRCDVTKQAEVAKLVQEAVERYSRLDVMVNNAGIYRGGKLAHEFSEEDLDACWTVNVKHTWFDCQEAVKQFLKQGTGGNIVNLVSTAGLQGHPNHTSGPTD